MGEACGCPLRLLPERLLRVATSVSFVPGPVCVFTWTACSSWARDVASAPSATNPAATEDATVVKDSYIVAFGSVQDRDVVKAALDASVLEAVVSSAAAASSTGDATAPSLTAELTHMYSDTFPGFAVTASEAALEFLAGREEVLAIVHDKVATLNDVARHEQRELRPTTLWGLDRIDQLYPPL